MIQQTKKPCVIKPGTPEFAAWADYFDRRVGERPLAFQMATREPNREFTVPTQWPEWFDTAAALMNETPRKLTAE